MWLKARERARLEGERADPNISPRISPIRVKKETVNMEPRANPQPRTSQGEEDAKDSRNIKNISYKK